MKSSIDGASCQQNPKNHKFHSITKPIQSFIACHNKQSNIIFENSSCSIVLAAEISKNSQSRSWNQWVKLYICFYGVPNTEPRKTPLASRAQQIYLSFVVTKIKHTQEASFASSAKLRTYHIRTSPLLRTARYSFRRFMRKIHSEMKMFKFRPRRVSETRRSQQRFFFFVGRL